jgi:soluble lytic murein transglycosylase
MIARGLILTFALLAVIVALTLQGRPTRAQPGVIIVAGPTIPAEAVEALREGRHFMAARILNRYLAETGDTAAAALLLAAQAAAGWGDWERTARLLDGRPWLDDEADGAGWALLGRARAGLDDWHGARLAWQRWLAVSRLADSRARAIGELRLAEALRALDAFDDAIAAYTSAADGLPEIGAWVRLGAAETAARAADTTAVETLLAGLDAELLRDWGWRPRVDAHRHAGAVERARAVAEAATAALTTASRRAEAWLVTGELRRDAGDAAGARAAYRRAIDAAPSSIAAIDAARMLTELGGLAPADQLAVGRVYARHGNLQRAQAGMEAWLAAGQGTARQREEVRLELAHALFRGARYDQAERQFLAVAERASSAAVGAEALFFAGRSQYRDGRTTQGRQTFLRVAQRYPATAAAARALYFSADLDHDDGDIARATERYRQAIATAAGTDEVGLAYMRLAGIAFHEGRWDDAIREYEAYRRAYPNGRRWAQATYWSALAHERLGRDSTARARLEEVRRAEPFGYYGGRAADRLGVGFWSVSLRTAPAASSAERDRIERALAGLDLLRELGWDAAAGWELTRVRRAVTTDAARYALAEALNARGLTAAAVDIGWDLHRRGGGWNERLLRIIYPFPYRPLVEAEARARGIEPYLAAGLMRQESLFQAAAVSPAGAVGLMQVMPETGRAVADRLGVRFHPDLLRNAEFNVHLGMEYLAAQIEAYDGRLPLVLSAYNAGPHRVARWEKLFPEFADDELFSERIPFAETREYVKIVQQNLRIYRALWGE